MYSDLGIIGTTAPLTYQQAKSIAGGTFAPALVGSRLTVNAPTPIPVTPKPTTASTFTPTASPLFRFPVLKVAPTSPGTTPTVSSGGQSFPASGGGPQTLTPVPAGPTIQYYPASSPGGASAASSSEGETPKFNMAGFGGVGLLLAAMIAVPLLLKRKG